MLPIARDGSKKSIGKWADWQAGTVAHERILQHWGGTYPAGIAIFGGACNGGLEILDFDEAALFQPFWEKLEIHNADLAARLRAAIVATPKGFHLYSRCRDTQGNQKLAQTATDKTLIETRGEGGYAVAPGSPLECHPLGKPYIIVSGAFLPDFLAAIPQILPSERALLHAIACTFDQRTNAPKAAPVRKPKSKGTRSGDDFNYRADFLALLESDGWQIKGQDEHGYLLVRPGKEGTGHSARLFNASADHPARLFSFSTNAGLQAERAYDAFAWFAARFHSGNFSEAAKALAAQGYGSQWVATEANNSAQILDCGADSFPIARVIKAANALAAELGFSPARRKILELILSEAVRAGADGWFSLSLTDLGLQLYPLRESLPEKQRRKRIRIISKQCSRELAALLSERDALRWLADSEGRFFPVLFEYEPGRIEKKDGEKIRISSRFRAQGFDILKRILNQAITDKSRAAIKRATREVLRGMAAEAEQEAPDLGHKPKPAAHANYRKSAITYARKYVEQQADKANALRELRSEIEKLAGEFKGSCGATLKGQYVSKGEGEASPPI